MTWNKLIIIFLFVFIVAFANQISAYQFDDIIDKANSAYQQENYEDALSDYLKVYKNGFESAELYYNIGNCYYRLGKLGYAILFYEKGLTLNPDDEDLLYNLSIAKAHTIDKINEVPQMFLVEWWDSFLAWFTLSGWAFISVTIYLLMLSGFGIYYFSNTASKRRIGFYIGVLFLSLTILSGVGLAAKYNKENSAEFGVLIEKTVTVKQSPNERAADAFVIHEGIKFSIEDKLDNWVKIKLSDGKVGWLQKGMFETI